MTEHTLDIVGDVLMEKLEAVEKEIELCLRRWAVEARGDARMDAPRRTGQLSSSITSKVYRDGHVITAVIGSNLEYAPYNEYGTGDRGSADYNGHTSDVTFTAGWPGMDPHPYLRPQIYDKESEILARVQDAIRKGLE